MLSDETRFPSRPPEAERPACGFSSTVDSEDMRRPDPQGTEGGLLPGTRIDHYEIRGPLGRGGMGAVYVAHDLNLDRPVAIKVLHAEEEGNAIREQRFIREAHAQAKLTSPRVVHIHFVGHLPATEGSGARPRLYFAMELVQGKSLEALVEERGPLPPDVVHGYAVQILEGLRDAERAGFIHRDIKPSNLLLAEGGYVKIADFGLAKSANEEVALTQEGTVVGSPLYMAPEQCKGEAVDFRADMYAVGCTLFHLLTGKPPFTGPTALVVLGKHLTAPPPRITARRAAVGAPLAAFVHRLLEKSPDARFASYDDALEALAAAAPSAERAVSPRTTSAALAVPGSNDAPPASKPPARSRAWLALGAALGVAAVGLFANRAIREPDPRVDIGTPAPAAIDTRPSIPATAAPPSAAPSASTAPSASAAPAPSARASVTARTPARPPPTAPACAPGEHFTLGHCCRVGLVWLGDRCDRPIATTPPF